LLTLAIVNARVGIENTNEQRKVYIWVRNLNNEYFVTSVVKNNEMVPAYSGMTRIFGITFENSAF